MLPDPDEVEALVLRQLGATSLFAAKFREAAARALLLPRRRIGGRTPLWQQRKRAADLLAVAARFGSFPMLLEAYRECLRDLFDVPALIETLRAIRERRLRVVTVDSTTPSPFAASLLFGYVANYLYDGDAPLAERRAQALSIDQAQLRRCSATPSCASCSIATPSTTSSASCSTSTRRAASRSVDGAARSAAAARRSHRGGDRGARGDRRRRGRGDRRRWCAARRALRLPVAGEHAARRGRGRQPLPRRARHAAAAGPAGGAARAGRAIRCCDLVMRYARTHGPFTAGDVGAPLRARRRRRRDGAARALVGAGRLHEGDFRPGGTHREWCEPGVLGQIRRRSLAKAAHAGRAGRAGRRSAGSSRPGRA